MEFTLTATFNATPLDVYNAWLDSEQHSDMIEGDAKASNKVGGHFTAWADYISGTNLELVSGKFIKQAWRTTEFEDTDEDSILELSFEKSEEGTLLTLKHSKLPSHGEQYINGWKEHYFEPMSNYFS